MLDAALAARVDAFWLDEERHSGIGEFAVAEQRTGVAGGALAAAKEQAEAALRRRRVGRRRLCIVAFQRGTEAIEWTGW